MLICNTKHKLVVSFKMQALDLIEPCSFLVLDIFGSANRSLPSVPDGFLFYLSGRGTQKHGRRRVVRSREEVHSTLTIYHNDMNHLELEKCLKLISQHFFWGSMRADVALWIQRCLQCSSSDKACGIESGFSPAPPEHLENILDKNRQLK